MARFRSLAPGQAKLMLEILEEQSSGATLRLREDALTELRSWGDVQVLDIDENNDVSGCSVAGTYNFYTSPPVLGVAKSASHRRRQFTVLHELGHHLQKCDAKLAVAVRRVGKDHDLFEDAACDSFAAKVLIPDSFEAELGERSPSASDVIRLFDSSSASRAACSVWCAERLGTNGVVVVLNRQGVVSFASAHGECVPPAKGSDQSGTPLISAALKSGNSARTANTFIRYRNGSESRQLYGDAEWSGDYLIAVAVMDRAGWLAFAPPRTEPGRFGGFKPRCSVCNGQLDSSQFCSTCRYSKCQNGHCRCPAIQERVCQRCFMSLHPNIFDTNDAVFCKECS